MTTDKLSKILLVDDNPQVLETMGMLFNDEYSTLLANSAGVAIEMANNHKDICAVVMDIKMPSVDGISAGRSIRRINPELPLIFFTAYSGEYDENEIERTEKPFDYIRKGDSSIELIRSVRNAVNLYMAQAEKPSLIEEAEQSYGIIGRSPIMVGVYKDIKRFASKNQPVLILGETGSGKELVAKALHKISARRNKSWGVLNCNHTNPTLIEAELFGYAKGSFTDAKVDTPGWFESADGGTVFLDEIGDLCMETQGKILRVVEDGEFSRVGELHIIRCSNVRVICATNKDLDSMASDGRFRPDLYSRLNVLRISLPPLREKPEDIKLLAEWFCRRATDEYGIRAKYFDDSALRVMTEYDWPRNIRELKNTIYRTIAMVDSDLIVAEDIHRALGMNSDPSLIPSTNLAIRVNSYERRLIIEALTQCQGNVTHAAKSLGIDRTTLQRKMKEHILDSQTFLK